MPSSRTRPFAVHARSSRGRPLPLPTPHQPPASSAGWLPPPVPGAVRQRRPDPGVYGGAGRAAHQAPGVPPVRRVRRPRRPPRVPPGGADRDASPPRRSEAAVLRREVAPLGGAAAVRRAGEAGHGGADAPVHLLRQREPLDGVRGVGVRANGLQAAPDLRVQVVAAMIKD
jgi:hypothetical protein